MRNAFFFLVSLLVLNACGVRGERPSKDQETFTMVNFSAFMPTLPQLEPGDIIYEFDWVKNEVKITSKLSGEQHVGPSPGVHPIEMIQLLPDGNGEVGKKLKIDNQEYHFSRSKNGKEITLDSNSKIPATSDAPAVQTEDAPVITLQRVKS